MFWLNRIFFIYIYFSLDINIAEIIIRILPTNKDKVSFSFNKITPKIILIIASKVPSIDAEPDPIKSIAFRSSTIETIVEITDRPI